MQCIYTCILDCNEAVQASHAYFLTTLTLYVFNFFYMYSNLWCTDWKHMECRITSSNNWKHMECRITSSNTPSPSRSSKGRNVEKSPGSNQQRGTPSPENYRKPPSGRSPMQKPPPGFEKSNSTPYPSNSGRYQKQDRYQKKKRDSHDVRSPQRNHIPREAVSVSPQPRSSRMSDGSHTENSGSDGHRKLETREKKGNQPKLEPLRSNSEDLRMQLEALKVSQLTNSFQLEMFPTLFFFSSLSVVFIHLLQFPLLSSGLCKYI